MTTVRSGIAIARPHAAYTPRNTVNSATNPTRPGRPSDARNAITENHVRVGMLLATPPSSEMFRVPSRGPYAPAAPERDGRRRRTARTHVAHGGERNEALQVVLREADERAVHDRVDPEEGEEPPPLRGGLLHHLHVHADEAVASELQEDPRQEDGAPRRGLHGRVRKPRVEGPRGRLRPESDQEAAENEAR